MRLTSIRAAVAVACSLAVSATNGCSSPPLRTSVDADSWARITAGLDGFLAKLEALADYPPGTAVVVVTGDGRRYIRLHGETKAGSGSRVTADSAFYIASMTKAYMGLLAARLDAEGVLPLSTTLAAVWRGLELPRGGRQADAIPLRDLLVHAIPFRAEEITFLEAYVRDVTPSEYPALLRRYAVARPEGFQYDNLGYNIYAAALEAKTGRNWRAWLNEKVFAPLGMTATSGRTSGYAAPAIAWGHQRAGGPYDNWPHAAGWYLLPPKADGMMQSAGGLMTSPNDMARWLEAHVRGEGPAGSGLTRAVFAAARGDQVGRPAEERGFSCKGYVYGWNVCRFIIDIDADLADRRYSIGPFFQHGGGYTGVRSLMTVAPNLGFGVAFLSNADSMTGYLGQEVTKLVFELSRDVAGADARRDRRLASYQSQNARYLDDLQSRLQAARDNAKWQGWHWRPSVAELAAFAGTYVREGALLPEATVEVVDGSLFLNSADRRFRLTPAARDLFGAQTFAYDEIAAVAFVRDAGGNVVALEWDGERYRGR